jgi:murein DD-endopeptidase
MRRSVNARIRGICIAALTAVSAITSLAQPTILRQSFDLQVPLAPTPVRVLDKMQLVYELHITNFALEEIALTRIQVLDAERRLSLGDFRDAQLSNRLGRPGPQAASTDKRIIAPGMRAVVYLSLSLDRAVAVPRRLRHGIEFDIVHSNGREHAVVEGGRVTVRNQVPVALGPPLRGGPWAAIYDPSLDRGHRRMIYAIDGRARIPARFAIDWFKLDHQGRFARDDSSKVANWYGYGAPVLAVADSAVADMRDGIAESESLSVPSGVPRTLENASGNYVALDLGEGRYAFYEHLKPASIRVRSGDHVKRGQVIAALGYTGDANGPHLHFHVSDGNATLAAEGLPYVFSDFGVIGAFETIDAFAKGNPWLPLPPGTARRRKSELPPANSVVEFGVDSERSGRP